MNHTPIFVSEITKDGLETIGFLYSPDKENTESMLRVTHDVRDPRVSRVDYLHVAEWRRGNGLGAQMLRSCAAHLQDEGFHYLRSNSLTTSALLARRRAFGEEALQFYDAEHPDEGVLPLSFDQAFDVAERVSVFNELRMIQRRRFYQEDLPNIELISSIGVLLNLQTIQLDERDLPGYRDSL